MVCDYYLSYPFLSASQFLICIVKAKLAKVIGRFFNLEVLEAKVTADTDTNQRNNDDNNILFIHNERVTTVYDQGSLAMGVL